MKKTLAVIALLLLSACNHGPELTVYISNPEKNGMDWSDEHSGKKGFIPYSETDKFVCMGSSDMGTLMNYCRNQHKSLELLGAGPAVTLYLSDPLKGGMEYYDELTQQSGFISYSETDRLICLNPPDMSLLLDYCKISRD